VLGREHALSRRDAAADGLVRDVPTLDRPTLGTEPLPSFHSDQRRQCRGHYLAGWGDPVRPPGLAVALGYANYHIIDRYCEDKGSAFTTAVSVFTDLRRWLWLVAVFEFEQRAAGPASRFELELSRRQSPLDAMWRTFLLFTRDYQEFCVNKLGRFVHHVPRTSNMPSVDEKPEQLRQTISYVSKRLGTEVASRWYQLSDHR
jgi:hypothetical protein